MTTNDRSVIACMHGLMSCSSQVDDRQTGMTQSNRSNTLGVELVAIVIWAPVFDFFSALWVGTRLTACSVFDPGYWVKSIFKRHKLQKSLAALLNQNNGDLIPIKSDGLTSLTSKAPEYVQRTFALTWLGSSSFRVELDLKNTMQ